MKTICRKPVYVETQGRYYNCGHCLACRLKRRSEWARRMFLDVHSRGGKAVSVTLTYNSKFCPKDYSLSVEHIQKFFKRLRFNLSKIGFEQKIKYYVGAEYGTKYKRPHYHAIIIGLSMKHSDIIFKSWGMCDPAGFFIRDCSDFEGMMYAAGYSCKKLGVGYNKKFERETGRKAEFQLCSLGLGYQWLLDNIDQVLQDKQIRMLGKKYPLPRYFKKKLGSLITKEEYEQMYADIEMLVLDQIVTENPKDTLVLGLADGCRGRNVYGGFFCTNRFFDLLDDRRLWIDRLLTNKIANKRKQIDTLYIEGEI